MFLSIGVLCLDHSASKDYDNVVYTNIQVYIYRHILQSDQLCLALHYIMRHVLNATTSLMTRYPEVHIRIMYDYVVPQG
jgi:hypothetical protein